MFTILSTICAALDKPIHAAVEPAINGTICATPGKSIIVAVEPTINGTICAAVCAAIGGAIGAANDGTLPFTNISAIYEAINATNITTVYAAFYTANDASYDATDNESIYTAVIDPICDADYGSVIHSFSATLTTTIFNTVMAAIEFSIDCSNYTAFQTTNFTAMGISDIMSKYAAFFNAITEAIESTDHLTFGTTHHTTLYEA